MRTMDARCQQFTSKEITCEMLDWLRYEHDLYGKKLLENSCGEGNILCMAVERYIQDALQRGYSSDEIVLGLERDIYGAEIVESTYNRCIENLNNVVKRYNLGNVHWNIFNGDVLTRPFDFMFDYVIGNPPYISYRNLEIETRKFLKENYDTCKEGKPDYCYAFIENAIQYLAPGGKMVYLIPNSIYKNVYAQRLRGLILQYIEGIRDYPNQKLFDNAMTSSAIMFLTKGEYVADLQYSNITEKRQITINKQRLTDKWVFNSITLQRNKVRFSDYYKASMAIATQRNKVFVVSEEKKNEYNFERGSLRPAVSPKNQSSEKKEYIIFPYKIRNHQVTNYGEDEFRMKYPNAYDYLESNREELMKRDADKAAKWFEFGRSQAIHNMNKKKLLISTVFTNEVKVYEVSNRAVPYAGIYIISENGYDLTIAKQILESDAFLQYIKGIGTPASGSSLRITANDINNFTFFENEFF